MPTQEYCRTPGCWMIDHHRGRCASNGPRQALTCQCLIPREGNNDECLKCRRVIADLVIKRREERR
jgi:hypothetical protein